jgi:hypothetical protein
MEKELLILPGHPWFIVEFVNTTGDTNGAGTINPSGASLVYSRVCDSVTRRVHELYYKPGMLRKD